MVIKHKFFNPITLRYFEEKYKDLPITLFWDYIPQSRDELNINPFNIFLAHEPNDFFGIQGWINANHHAFDAVLSWDENVLSHCTNSIAFFCGWMFDSDFITPNKKTFEVSFLSGVKDITEGHRLRQYVLSLENKINIPKKWYRVLDDFDHENNVRPGYTEYAKDLSHIPEGVNPETYGKQPLFDSMFHITIENVKRNNWYTEKIQQAFLNKTVPIYWGCPNIGEIGYDPRGIITFDTENELISKVNSLTPEEYNKRLPFIEYNYEVAKQDTLKNKLTYILDQIKILNNL